MNIFPSPGSFYFITPTDLDLDEIDQIVRPCISSGLPALQIRREESTELEAWCKDLINFISKEELRCKLIVNNNINLLERLCRSTFVKKEQLGIHLKDNFRTTQNFGAQEIRKEFGNSIILGRSSHQYTEHEHSEEEFLDYRSLSPIYKPISKETGEALGIKVLANVVKQSRIPVFALGGVTLQNVGEILACGAGFAMIGSVFSNFDPINSYRRISARLSNHTATH